MCFLGLSFEHCPIEALMDSEPIFGTKLQNFVHAHVGPGCFLEGNVPPSGVAQRASTPLAILDLIRLYKNLHCQYKGNNFLQLINLHI